ncbi:MAG: hypothetical protein GX300_01025 [Tissierellia bacterium]|nr:hypothetical protein [Tissierellia bacterium]
MKKTVGIIALLLMVSFMITSSLGQYVEYIVEDDDEIIEWQSIKYTVKEEDDEIIEWQSFKHLAEDDDDEIIEWQSCGKVFV